MATLSPVLRALLDVASVGIQHAAGSGLGPMTAPAPTVNATQGTPGAGGAVGTGAGLPGWLLPAAALAAGAAFILRKPRRRYGARRR